ncbi:DUF2637 domain-containing protein [Streptomyces sp. CA-243310]|uniref:DUF2637 domain-containing protein n=1 Tax=Streptomyces sp. CA-243310 TaxID=3240056 RepID=UPI003D8F55DB
MSTSLMPTGRPAPPRQGPVPASADPTPPATVGAPPAAPTAPPASEAAPVDPRQWPATAMGALIIAAVLCAAVIAGIGFVGSYTALKNLATTRGFGYFAAVFPIGVDAGIVAMYALDLILVWRRMPKPLLRLIAHGLTLATIVFNAYSGARSPLEDPLTAAMHAVMPMLFLAVVEAVRHLIIRTNRLSMSADSDRVPLHRWALAPWPTWRLYRRMRLWEINSYTQMVAMDRDRIVYRAYLKHKYGRGWRRKAGANALLPFTMGSYGLTVAQALALPQEQKESEARRAAAEQERIATATAREEQRILDAEERAAAAQVRRLEIAATVTAAKHRIAAETIVAEAEARAAEVSATSEAESAAHTARLSAEAARRQAERDAQTAELTAERAEQAGRSAAEAEAEARKEEAIRIAAEHRKATAAATAEAAETERSAMEDRRRAAEADRIAQEHREAEAEAEAKTAELNRRTAEHREATERAEVAAMEAEDLARVPLRERAERKVARMILAAWNALPAEQRPERPDMYAVSLDEVGEALSVKQSVAGVRRQAAADLIAAGYTG